MKSVGTHGPFPTTQWTIISRLRSKDDATVQQALEDICAQYHYPLYCFIRHSGFDHHDAEDALQDFMAKLLRLNTFAQAHAGKGRLRTLLITSLRRFLINWCRDRPHRQRECGIEIAPETKGGDEDRYLSEVMVEGETPERFFERKWGHELLETVLRLLAEDYDRRGSADVFAALRPVLMAGGSLRGEDAPRLSATLGLSENALRLRLSRLLKEFREKLESEVFLTVGSREEVGEEISYLMNLFSR